MMLIKMAIFSEKLQELPSGRGLCLQAPILVNLAFSNCSKNVQNVVQNGIKMATFFLKNCKNSLAAVGFAPRPPQW